jgi:hypothetical protein
LTDSILSAVHELVREDGPFVSALARTRDTATAIARALETIAADVRASSRLDGDGVRRLEALLHARLADGVKRGEIGPDQDIGDLAAFYANVVAGLVAEAFAGGDEERLAALPRVAMGVLPRTELASA